MPTRSKFYPNPKPKPNPIPHPILLVKVRSTQSNGRYVLAEVQAEI